MKRVVRCTFAVDDLLMMIHGDDPIEQRDD